MALLLLLVLPTSGTIALFAQTQPKSQGERKAEVTGAFGPGETLFFNIRYGMAKGAEAQFITKDTVVDGRRLFKHTIWGVTTGFVGAVYPLTDYYHSFTDPRTNLPLRAVRDVHEQKYVDYKEDRFLYGVHSSPDSVLVVRETGDTLVQPKGTHDLVSVVYYVRNQLERLELKQGTTIHIPTFFNGEYFPLAIRYLGREVVKTKFGKVECHKFMPLVLEGDLFKSQDAITVWFSTCKNHVPVRVRFKVFLGSMYCDLVSYKGLAHPLYVKF